MINFCPRYVEPRIIVRRVPRGTRGTLVTAMVAMAYHSLVVGKPIPPLASAAIFVFLAFATAI
jgi:hypothetical protein